MTTHRSETEDSHGRDEKTKRVERRQQAKVGRSREPSLYSRERKSDQPLIFPRYVKPHSKETQRTWMVKTALLTWNHENASTSADPCGLSLCNRSTTKILSSGVRNFALSNEGGKTNAAKSPTATVMRPSTMNNHRHPFSGIEVPGRCPLPPSLLRPVASSPPKLSTSTRIHQVSALDLEFHLSPILPRGTHAPDKLALE
jgi:hypothetical protein